MTTTLDYLIIGAGPAGLQLAALFEADGDRDYLALERAEGPGAFFTRFPRHRRLISINKPHTGSTDPEFNLRLDWNSLLSEDPALRFTRYTGRYFPDADLMVTYLADFAAKTGARVRYGCRVTRIGRRTDGTFEVVVDETSGPRPPAGEPHPGRPAAHEPRLGSQSAGEQAGRRTFLARRLVVATGVSQPYLPDIPGIDLAEGYADMPVDPDGFTDQRVLVVGKGNSAFETADNLMETTALVHVAGPGPVRMAWRTHYVGHLRAVNNNFLDTYQLKSANAVLDGDVLSIQREDGEYRVDFSFSRADEVVKRLRYDRVLICTGFRFDASIFDPTCQPNLAINNRFPEQTPAFESTNIPNLYFAGTLTQQRDFKKSTNGFIHGFRYTTRALHHILQTRHHHTPWPHTTIDPTPETITDAIINRVNRSSGLWQQFAVLADVITIAGQTARYHEEVPVAYFAEHGLSTADHRPDLAFTVALEYGPHHDRVDPFDITVNRVAQDVPGRAHDAAYLHPVVRYHRGGRPLATHHLAENLENRWDRPDVHRAPLVDFVRRGLTGAGG